MILRSLRRAWHVWERTPPFFVALFSRNGLFSAGGRQLTIGKIRRILISFSPALAKSLQKRYGISGGCTGCGASCNIMFKCPHWSETTHLCTVYEDRPNICRLFPITPSDIADRDLVRKDVGCGFKFSPPK